MTTVVAAVISRGQDVLVCQRSATGTHPLKWEFPGGKVEAGESLEIALERELREELTITALHPEEITRYEFAYPAKPPILLIFFSVGQYSGNLQNQVFQQIEWSPRAKLARYDFLEGDLPFIRLFGRGID
jgi:8-oxo-dGTP diphosphatase